MPSVTTAELVKQWRNPTDIFSILLIIGGNIVQNALAQVAGDSPYIAPVCFSFGWVAYSFTTLIEMIGEGRLMPEPDCPCKVINLRSGYARQNRSWVLGRLLADDESRTAMKTDGRSDTWPETRLDPDLTVNVYKWSDEPSTFDIRIPISVAIILGQLLVSIVPFVRYGDWGVLFITGLGTSLALVTGSLHQWKAEKSACRSNKTKDIALTRGNGCGHVMIIRTENNGYDLEDLAAAEGPRVSRVWEKHGWFTRVLQQRDGRIPPNQKSGSLVKDGDKPRRRAILSSGLPRDFWFTRIMCSALFACWLLLLTAATGLTQHTWYLLLVGGLGMVQNAFLAASRCSSAVRGVPLTRDRQIMGAKVMDVLMDLECLYEGLGRKLRDEFFPGELRPDEIEWWNGKKEAYDDRRKKEEAWRGAPPRPPPSSPAHN